MQKTNPGRKDQTKFNPRVQSMINTKHTYHWLNTRSKHGLIFSAWIHFLHTAVREMFHEHLISLSLLPGSMIIFSVVILKIKLMQIN